MAMPKKKMLWSPWEAISCFAKPDLKWVAQMCSRVGFRLSGSPRRVPGGAAVILGGGSGGPRGATVNQGWFLGAHFGALVELNISTKPLILDVFSSWGNFRRVL